MARRKLIPGRIALFGYEVAVDWADPESDVNEDVVNRVKNVFVRNLKPTTSEFTVWAAFNSIRPGSIEKVKKADDRDFAYVYFHKREDAIHAVQMMNGKLVDGQEVLVSMGKPNAILKQTNGSKLLGISPNANFASSNFHCNDLQYNPGVFGNRPQTGMQHSYGVPSPASFGSTLCNDFPPVCTSYSFSIKPNLSAPMVGAMGCAQPQNVRRDSAPSPNVLGGPNLPCGRPRPLWPTERKLRPALTMDHIAKIKCPVTLLGELCSRLDLGSAAPHYILLLDDEIGQSTSKYVYRVQFANNLYTPPISSNTVEEAKRIAAQYVIDQIAPWLKLKLDSLIAKRTTLSPSMDANGGSGTHFSNFPQLGNSSFLASAAARNGVGEATRTKLAGDKLDGGTQNNVHAFTPGFSEAMSLQSYPEYLKHLNPVIAQNAPASASGLLMPQQNTSSAF